MAVPAGDVGGVEAGHGFGLDDEILDALVEGVAEVDGSVGIGRAVVEDVFGSSSAGGANLGIQVLLLPYLEAFWLVLGQIRLHREGRLGQVQGRLQRFGRWVDGVFSSSNGQVQGRLQRCWSGFLIFGVSLGCVRHLFLMFLKEEVQFAPNSYCSRAEGRRGRGIETFTRDVRPR